MDLEGETRQVLLGHDAVVGIDRENMSHGLDWVTEAWSQDVV